MSSFLPQVFCDEISAPKDNSKNLNIIFVTEYYSRIINYVRIFADEVKIIHLKLCQMFRRIYFSTQDNSKTEYYLHDSEYYSCEVNVKIYVANELL